MANGKLGPDGPLRGFVALEGIDGTGTSTQLKALGGALAARGLPFAPTCEPTRSETGALLRKALKGELDLEPGTVARLFVADRYEHVYGKGGILSSLARGTLVVSDRYLYSSLVYQGLECGLEEPYELNRCFPEPGLVLWFKIDPRLSMARLASRPQKDLFENLAFQERAAEAYRALFEGGLHPGFPRAEILVVEADRPIDDVTSFILRSLEERSLVPAV